MMTTPWSEFSVARKINHKYHPMEVGPDHVNAEGMSMAPWMQIQNGSLLRENYRPREKCTDWRKVLKMNKSVLVILAMLLLTATMPFLWHCRISPEQQEEDEAEKRLSRVVRSLNSVQAVEEQEELQKHAQSSNDVLQHFPWIVHNGTLPNYFLGGGTHTGSADRYHNGAMVFLHHHRAGGAVVSDCLASLAQRRMFAKVPPWNSDSRFNWENVKDNRIGFQEDGVKVHMGQYSFGMCNNYNSSACSYFTMLRDPLEREVSSYHYCKNIRNIGGTDEMCQVLDANEVTLRDWVLHHGSLSFQQLLFSAHWCQNLSLSDHSLGGTDVGFSDPAGWPCWFKNRLWVDALTPVQQRHLLDYVLDHLDKWFAVIGLVEEFDSSVQMFENVYSLPFSKCSGVKKFIVDDNGIHDNRANRNTRKDGYYDDNDPNYLKYDYFVRKALEADMQIYKKAKKIFNIQRQMVFNKINR